MEWSGGDCAIGGGGGVGGDGGDGGGGGSVGDDGGGGGGAWKEAVGGIELLILVFTGATIHSFFTGKCKMEKTLLSGQNTAETQTQQRTSKIYQLFPGFLVGKTFMMFPHLFAPVPKNPSFWLNQASSSYKRFKRRVGRSLGKTSLKIEWSQLVATILLVSMMIVEKWVAAVETGVGSHYAGIYFFTRCPSPAKGVE